MNIFCSIAKKDVKGLNDILLQSIRNQIFDEEVTVNIIDYTGKNLLKEEDFNTEGLSFNIIKNDRSLGFGEAHNELFKEIKPSKFFLIVNPDVCLHEKCLINLVKYKEEIASPGILECRQLPFEHPKEYDDETLETPWASGAAMFVNPVMFDKVNGFDENFWMYNEDVDLSWKSWIEGYSVNFIKMAVAYHFTGAHFSYNPTRYYTEHFWSLRNFIYISKKYFGIKGERKAISQIKNTSYPENLLEEVYKSYEQIPYQIPKDPDFFSKAKNHKYIKIMGVNKFHEFKQ